MSQLLVKDRLVLVYIYYILVEHCKPNLLYILNYQIAKLTIYTYSVESLSGDFDVF